jgi:hypothetical protein
MYEQVKNNLLAWFPLNSCLYDKSFNDNSISFFGEERYVVPNLVKSKALVSGSYLIHNLGFNNNSGTSIYYFNDIFYAKSFDTYYSGKEILISRFNLVAQANTIGSGFTGYINDVLYYSDDLTREEIYQIKDYIDFYNSLEVVAISHPVPRLPQEYDVSLVGSWMNVLSPYQTNKFVDFSDENNPLSGQFFERSGYAYRISGSYFYDKAEDIKTSAFWVLEDNDWNYYVNISGVKKLKNSQDYIGELPIEISSTGIYSPNSIFIQNLQIYNEQKSEDWADKEYSLFLQNKTGLVFGTVDGESDFSRFRNSFSYSKNDEYPFFTGNLAFNNNIDFNSYSYWISVNSQQSGWANYAFDGTNNFRNNVAFDGVMPLGIYNTGVSLTTYSKVSYLQLFTGNLSQDFLSRDYNKYKRFF